MPSETLHFTVGPAGQGQRLDQFLAVAAGQMSRSRLKKLIDQGQVQVDSCPAKAGQRLKAGQEVRLSLPPKAPSTLVPDPEARFDILYEDREVVVVNKPAGLVVHPGAGHQTGTLVHGLLARCPDLAGVGEEVRPGIVHRLDKDTSGVMVVAKTDAAHRFLVEQFSAGEVEKSYLALCLGWPGAPQGEIKTPIGRHPVRRKEMSTRSRRGRPALTRWEVLERFDLGLSLLRLNLVTGRTHQIRVHLSSLGCPVLGDRVYRGGLRRLKNSGGPLRGLVKRQMLHARTLKLTHPGTGQAMTFEAPLPADMTEVLALLAQERP